MKERKKGWISWNLLAGRTPQAQVDPVGLVFSVPARSQVHSPAGRAPTISPVSILVLQTSNRGNKARCIGFTERRASSPQRACSKVERGRERRPTARAACPGDLVLGLGFLAVAFEGGLLAAGALGLSSADAGLAGAAAAGGWDWHGDYGNVCGELLVVGFGFGVGLEEVRCGDLMRGKEVRV